MNPPLFKNPAIKRHLSSNDIQVVLEDLKKHGNLEWIQPGSKCHILWKTPEQWGQVIYDWVKENGGVNTVFTLFEIVNDNEGQSFHKLDQDILMRALKTLEKKKKAEVFKNGEGVKFF